MTALRGLPDRLRGLAHVLVARLRRLVGRVVDRLVLLAPAPPPGLRTSGPAGGGDQPDPVLVLLLDVPLEIVQASVAALVRVTAEQPGLIPILVMDRPHFALGRRAGFPVEHVISRVDWQRRHPDQPWRDYLALRLVQLQAFYRARQVVPAGSVDADVLAEVLRPARISWPRRQLRRLTVAVVGRLDPPLPER